MDFSEKLETLKAKAAETAETVSAVAKSPSAALPSASLSHLPHIRGE